MTFFELPATLFEREAHSSVRLSVWEDDFSQNATSLFRSENSLDCEAELVEKWLFSKL